jgi:hypothetical protein
LWSQLFHYNQFEPIFSAWDWDQHVKQRKQVYAT